VWGKNNTPVLFYHIYTAGRKESSGERRGIEETRGGAGGIPPLRRAGEEEYRGMFIMRERKSDPGMGDAIS